MNAPETLLEWVAAKANARRWAGVREPRNVTHAWRLQTDGRVLRAGLSASVTASDAFMLMVEADGVAPECVAGAKDGVITVLLSQSYTPVLACTVRLFAFIDYEDESPTAAFYNVAKEATQRLLGVVPGFTHNIEW